MTIKLHAREVGKILLDHLFRQGTIPPEFDCADVKWAEKPDGEWLVDIHAYDSERPQ